MTLEYFGKHCAHNTSTLCNILFFGNLLDFHHLYGIVYKMNACSRSIAVKGQGRYFRVNRGWANSCGESGVHGTWVLGAISARLISVPDDNVEKQSTGVASLSSVGLSCCGCKAKHHYIVASVFLSFGNNRLHTLKYCWRDYIDIAINIARCVVVLVG